MDEVIPDQSDVTEVVDQYVATANLTVPLVIPELRQPAAELLFPNCEDVREPLRIRDGEYLRMVVDTGNAGGTGSESGHPGVRR
ncbi:hypothetical protein [Mycobacterium sp. URHB0021]